ncbi:MAG: HEAT repeat domain-containing protein [Planctomycetota bacterium]
MIPIHALLLVLVPQGNSCVRFELQDGGYDPEQQAQVILAVRVEAARLALASGRLEDFVKELDLVLGQVPDHADARALIANAPLALTLPSTAERTLPARLVLFGARAKPAYRELAASRLTGAPREEAVPELERGLRSPSASVRAFSAFALRRIDPKLRADALVRRSVVDPSPVVRTEAARALRDAKDESLARRVEAAFALEDSELRSNAASSLGEMGYRSSVPALAAGLTALQSSGHPGGYRAHILIGNQVAYVQDYNLEIAQGASIADPIVNVVEDATQLDVRVGGTSGYRIEVEGPTICRALARLTGEKLQEKPAPWLAWWKENAARFSGGPAKPSTGD